MAFNQWIPDPVEEAERRSFRNSMDKANQMRQENKDIPHLIEVLIALGIEREEFKQELLKILNS